MSFDKQARQIATPITANPSQTLAEVFLGLRFQCSLNFCLFVILHSNFLVMRVHPSRDEVVIISIKLHGVPDLVGEAMGESRVLQNIASVCNSTTGEARKSAVNVQARRTIEISPFQVRRAQKIAAVFQKPIRLGPSQAL